MSEWGGGSASQVGSGGVGEGQRSRRELKSNISVYCKSSEQLCPLWGGGDLKSNNIPVYRKIADCQHNTCVLLSPRNQHLLQQAYDKLERGYRVQHCILSSQHPFLVVNIFNIKTVKTVCNYQNIALLYVTFPL